MRGILAVMVLILSGGCALIPQRSAHYSLRAYCREAAEQGWCSTECGKRQPAYCFPWKLTSRSRDGFFCTYSTVDGGLIFAACPAGG